MRLILTAAILIALALPTHAQRLDTRRIDVRPGTGEITCGFNAYPEMQLIDATGRNGGKQAIWRSYSDDGDAELQLNFRPAITGWRQPPFVYVGFWVRGEPELVQAVKSARARVDGRDPISLPILYSEIGLHFPIGPEMQTNGERIANAHTVDLGLFDARGVELRHYGWDTHRLIDAVETVSVVGWSCTSP